MTYKEKQAEKRAAEIVLLATQAIEWPQSKSGGSVILVPCASNKKPGDYGVFTIDNIGYYRVDMDENYQPVRCGCPARIACKHMAAASLAVAPILDALLDNEANPVYEFVRDGMYILARFSQFSGREKEALRQQKREERAERQRRREEERKQAERRALYVLMFNPNQIAC